MLARLPARELASLAIRLLVDERRSITDAAERLAISETSGAQSRLQALDRIDAPKYQSEHRGPAR